MPGRSPSPRSTDRQGKVRLASFLARTQVFSAIQSTSRVGSGAASAGWASRSPATAAAIPGRRARPASMLMPVAMVVAVVVPVAMIMVVRMRVVFVTVVAMIVMVMIVMVMGMTMLAGMLVSVAVVVRMTMVVVVMTMAVIVMMIMAVVVAAGAVVVRHLLGAERAADGGGGAALAADQLGGGRRGGNVEHVGTDLGRDMVAAELPREAQEACRVLRPDFQKIFRTGPDDDEPAILQTQGIAVLQRAGLGQRHVEGEAAGRGEGGGRGGPGGVVELHRVGDAVGADRRAADDRGGFQHGRLGGVAAGACRLVPVA